jgi:hypothetical protein
MSLDASQEIQIRTNAVLLFAITFAFYFVSRSPALDEIDSVNFAMGIRHFDLWNHQPHPPGYPLFVFAGWIGVYWKAHFVELYLIEGRGAQG